MNLLKRMNSRLSELLLEKTHICVKSEAWRFEWVLRTCITTAVLSVLCLNPHSVKLIPAPGFAAFIAVLAADITFGRTVSNGISIIVGVFLASVVSWLLHIACGGFLHKTPSIVLLTVLCFVGQYIDFILPLAKKVSFNLQL
jgi:hypothetical protein